MKSFFKFGLPWAISLGFVFFLGLYLGSERIVVPDVPISKSGPWEHNPQRTSAERKAHEIESIQTNRVKGKFPTKSPPMPPNLQRIMQGADIVERLGSYLDAVRSMDKSNVRQVIQAFEELPNGYGRHLEMKLLMRSWTNFDPEGALAYASTSLDAKSERRFGISEALAGWAVKDLDAAIEWARNNHAGPDPNDNPLLVGIVKGLMETDLDAANRLFLSLPNGTAKWQSSTILADKFARSGTNEAIAWASNYPRDEPRQRETVLGQISAKLAQQDLPATAYWAKTMDPEPGALRVVENLIANWADRDPANAAKWIDQLENPDRKMHAMNELCGRWALSDPVATAEWLNTYPPSRSLDRTISTFVNRIHGKDPEGAIGWAQSIADPKLRQESTAIALETWRRTDPAKADSWQRKTGNAQSPGISPKN